MRNAVLTVLGLVLCIGVANATVPEVDLCSVAPCDDFLGVVLYPQPNAGGAAEFTVNARNADNDPIPNAFVELTLGTPGNHMLCSDAVMTGTTDAAGNVTFAISGGGCTMGADAFTVKVNGVNIRTFENVKSPDYAPGSNGNVELADFIYFGNQMSTSAAGCADYYNTGATGLGSFIVFGEAFTHQCP
jgi:hypothetical protein